MPQISVIVPVDTGEQYLRRWVDSILGQTFADFELILVDDGSPDNCPAICDEYAVKDSRVHVIHQENGGLSAARNAGIDWAFANSDSQWLSFVDSDDWVHPCYLAFMLKAALENHVHISACQYQNVSFQEPYAVYANCKYRTISPEKFYIASPANATVACGKIYWKKDFESIRYPVGRLHEDVYITHLLLFQNETIAVTEFDLYFYFTNPSGITHSVSSQKTKDALEGQRIRLKFFKENGFIAAYEYERSAPGYIAVEMAAMKDHIIPENRSYWRELKSRMRYSLRERKIELKGHEWLY